MYKEARRFIRLLEAERVWGRILNNGKLLQSKRKSIVDTGKLMQRFSFNREHDLRNYSSESESSVVEPFKMKLDSKKYGLEETLFTPDVYQLAKIVERYGYELRIVGGAVRDILLHRKPSDIDFASTATPDQMEEMFVAEGVERTCLGGERYGTVTVRLNDSRFEITALQLPKEDQYDAQEFTTDWRVGATQRDFTINAMYLGFDGVVYDYFNGLDDIDGRKVRCIVDPATLMNMNPACILRYFRFYGSICERPNDHDPEVLDAITTNRALLAGVSPMRMWKQFNLILKGQFKHELLKTMIRLGLSPYLGLPKNGNVEELDALFERAGDLFLSPVTILTALLRDVAEMKTLKRWLPISAYSYNMGVFILNNRDGSPSEDALQSYKILLENSGEQSAMRKCIVQLLTYRGERELLRQFNEWVETVPLNDDRSRTLASKLNQRLIMSELEKRLGSDMLGLSKQQLHDGIDEVMKEFKQKGSSVKLVERT